MSTCTSRMMRNEIERYCDRDKGHDGKCEDKYGITWQAITGAVLPHQNIFVVVSIGCLECGDTSEIFGVFSSREEADAAWLVHASTINSDLLIEWFDESKDEGGLHWYGDGKIVGYKSALHQPD